jgi:hypothetical protein
MLFVLDCPVPIAVDVDIDVPAHPNIYFNAVLLPAINPLFLDASLKF